MVFYTKIVLSKIVIKMLHTMYSDERTVSHMRTIKELIQF